MLGILYKYCKDIRITMQVCKDNYVGIVRITMEVRNDDYVSMSG